MLSEGRVMRGVGGLYEVRIPEGEGERRVVCRGRGALRRDDERLLVGDLCLVREEGEEAVIERILPRRTALIRPPLANADLLFIVTAASHPAPSLDTLDKLTAITVHNGITPVMVVTKADLDGTAAEALAAVYRAAGFSVFVLSPELDSSELSAYIAENVRDGRCAAFAGASGVGKSTLLNRLFPSLSLATGDISRKIARGRHTTRSVELFLTPEGGFLADTPGFSMLDFLRFDFFTLEDLPASFPEFLDELGGCRYADCTHPGEVDCGVAIAVREGRIAASRHESYRALYKILKEKKNKY
ncbi:MAG: ribosome small subunit-dependent GTPase A [Clostridia bacterium]|nr:ribosome small subunit-dependent GTPase A [Clostridia bacterium]